ncbi:MAG: hypothetical protein WCG81_11305 [Candidatus Angelobacter sp.]
MIAMLAVAALCCGCSVKQNVGIMAGKWEVGERQECIFRQDQLYCIPVGVDAMGVHLQAITRDGKQIPRRTMLFSNAVEIVHVFERKRSEARSNGDADAGSQAVKFSERPTNYSTWDCFKVGLDSPGISCALSLKPSEKTMPFFFRKEEEAQMDDALTAMNMDALQSKCGKPVSVTSDGVSRSLIYTPDSGTPIAFKFATHGNAFLLDSAMSLEKKAPHNLQPNDPLKNEPLKIFWWKSAPGRGMREAEQLVSEMPCLRNERTQELTARVRR